MLNAFANTNAAFNVLHRAACTFIWRPKDEGRRTEVEKWCSSSEADLVEYADQQLGSGGWKRCGFCCRAFPIDDVNVSRELAETALLSEPPSHKQGPGVWIPGEPAAWVSSGEKAWRETVVEHLTQSPVREKPSGLSVDFRLAPSQLFKKDIDNLITPVLSAARDAGWLVRGFSQLGCVTARKLGASSSEQIGVLVQPVLELRGPHKHRSGVLVETAVANLNQETIKWALYDEAFELYRQRPELRLAPQTMIKLDVTVTVENSAPRKSLQDLMKPCIDGLEPLLGHPMNLEPVPRDQLQRALAPQDEMVVEFTMIVRGGRSHRVETVMSAM